jgi:hypothetical protein
MSPICSCTVHLAVLTYILHCLYLFVFVCLLYRTVAIHLYKRVCDSIQAVYIRWHLLFQSWMTELDPSPHTPTHVRAHSPDRCLSLTLCNHTPSHTPTYITIVDLYPLRSVNKDPSNNSASIDLFSHPASVCLVHEHIFHRATRRSDGFCSASTRNIGRETQIESCGPTLLP